MPQRFDEIYKALSDTHRRRILAAVCREPMVAGDLARLVQLAPNAVSFHLKWLRSAGLVTVRRQGKYLHYSADAGGVGMLRGHVNELFSPAEGATVGSPRHAKNLTKYPLVRKQRLAPRVRKAGSEPQARGTLVEEETLPTELL